MEPEVIAVRPDEPIYLVETQPNVGRILDRDRMVYFPEAPMLSLVARGPWEEPDADLPSLDTLLDGVAVELPQQTKSFNPDQPRDDHGRWTSGGGGDESAVPSALTDPAARSAYVGDQIKAAGGMNGPMSTRELYDTYGGVQGAYPPEREAMHADIINEAFAKNADVPNDRMAIISGGLPGAGKTSSLTNPDLKDAVGVDTSQYMSLNSDDFKEAIAERGAYEQVDDLSPMEHAALLHNEAGDVCDTATAAALLQGKNVLFDITGNSEESYMGRISSLEKLGYTVRGTFVDVTVDTAQERAFGRYSSGQQAYENGSGLGGRYVPSDIIAKQASTSGSGYASKNREYFETVKNNFNGGYVILDNNGDGKATVVESTP